MIEDALLAVLNRCRDRVRFLSVGVPLSPRLRSHPAVGERETPRQVIRDYRKFVSFARDLAIDVGIAPLTDNPFNRCKSDVKFQEYSALGIPAVYSDLPPYRDSVHHGINGYRAANTAEWVHNLNLLVESPDLRGHIRATAAQQLLARWRVPWAHGWDEVLCRAEHRAQTRKEQTTHDVYGSVLEEVLNHQATMERKLKRTVEYQVGRTIKGLINRLAG
jgi:hypothetical protein